MAVSALLIAALCGGQLAADARLRADWNDLVASVANRGVILSGAPDAGWTALTVTGATAAGAPFLPSVTIESLTLSRPLWNLCRLTVTTARPVTLVFPDGRQLDLWSRGARVVLAGERWHFRAEGVGASLHGGDPDDVTSLEAVGGDLADTASGWRVAAQARDVTLPVHGTWPNGRLVARVAATLQMRTAPVPPGQPPDAFELHVTDFSWAGQTGRLSFGGSLDDHCLLAGRGEIVLGPGWAGTLKRAHAEGALTAGEAQAAIGFLGLLAPDERRAVGFPVTVAAGRVEVGPSTLFVLPEIPFAC